MIIVKFCLWTWLVNENYLLCWEIELFKLWIDDLLQDMLLNFKYGYYMDGNSISLGCGNETIWEIMIIGKVDIKRYRISLSKVEMHKLL